MTDFVLLVAEARTEALSMRSGHEHNMEELGLDSHGHFKLDGCLRRANLLEELANALEAVDVAEGLA